MIYDCFPYNGETDLLEIRLNHHNSFVDKFVISEATYTYSGIPKPLYYDEIKNLPTFYRFKDKIIHIIFDTPPTEENKGWFYEISQRNSLLSLLPEFTDSDLILYLDCDEIIRNKSVIDITIRHPDVLVNLDMDMLWYYLNCKKDPDSKYASDYSMEECFQGRWHMGKICRKLHLEMFRENLYAIREYFVEYPEYLFTIFDSGWHFSNLGDPNKIYNKFNAFSHYNEFNKKYKLSPKLIEERKRNLIDPLGRDIKLIKTEILDVPQYVIDNKERFKNYIL